MMIGVANHAILRSAHFAADPFLLRSLLTAGQRFTFIAHTNDVSPKCFRHNRKKPQGWIAIPVRLGRAGAYRDWKDDGPNRPRSVGGVRAKRRGRWTGRLGIDAAVRAAGRWRGSRT